MMWVLGLLMGTAYADFPSPPGSQSSEVGMMEGPPLGIGAGVVLGVPVGASVSWRPGDAFALQGTIGWHGQEQRVSTSVDLLINILDMESQDIEDGRFVAYAGPGAVVRWGWIRSVQLSNRQVEKPMMGLRVPAGVVYLPEERPVDVFLELVPTVYFIPESELDVTAVVGARVYFGGPKTHL